MTGNVLLLVLATTGVLLVLLGIGLAGYDRLARRLAVLELTLAALEVKSRDDRPRGRVVPLRRLP